MSDGFDFAENTEYQNEGVPQEFHEGDEAIEDVVEESASEEGAKEEVDVNAYKSEIEALKRERDVFRGLVESQQYAKQETPAPKKMPYEDIGDEELITGRTMKQMLEASLGSILEERLSPILQKVQGTLGTITERQTSMENPEYQEVIRHTADFAQQDPEVIDIVKNAPNRAKAAYLLGRGTEAYIQKRVQEELKKFTGKVKESAERPGTMQDVRRAEGKEGGDEANFFRNLSKNARRQLVEDTKMRTDRPRSYYLSIK